MTSWTSESSEGDEKPEGSYADLVREHYRSCMMQMWAEIRWEHVRQGCPLIPKEDGSVAGACILHGRDPDGPEMTFEEWMGSCGDDT
jgi:hypothetical protein